MCNYGRFELICNQHVKARRKARTPITIRSGQRHETCGDSVQCLQTQHTRITNKCSVACVGNSNVLLFDVESAVESAT